MVVTMAFIPLMILVFSSKLIFESVSGNKETSQVAYSYLKYALPGLFFQLITLTLAIYLTLIGNGLKLIVMMIPLVIGHMGLSYILNETFGMNGLAMASNITYFAAFLGFVIYTIVSKDEVIQKCLP